LEREQGNGKGTTEKGEREKLMTRCKKISDVDKRQKENKIICQI
jgi:hypothetical protein